MSFVPRLTSMAGAVAIGCCALIAQDAHAWGLKTHLWIAEKIQSDLQSAASGRCSLGVGLERRYTIPKEACDAIRQHPAEFRAGVLGPDVFPDFISGQVSTHPGDQFERPDPNGKWPTGKYLERLLEKAQHPEEIAFAYGYLVHAAGDVFAHSYVNNYAGDVFEAFDQERHVERRHVVLEKYIEAHTPLPASLILNKQTVRVPARFVREQLVFDPDFQKQYLLAKTMHLVAMDEARKAALPDATVEATIAALGEAVAKQAARLRALYKRKLADARKELALASLQVAMPDAALASARAQLKQLGAGDAAALIAAAPSQLEARLSPSEPFAQVGDMPLGQAQFDDLKSRLAALEGMAGNDAVVDQRAAVDQLAQVRTTLDGMVASAAREQPSAVQRRDEEKQIAEIYAMLDAASSLKREGSLATSTLELMQVRRQVLTLRATRIVGFRQEVERLEAEAKAVAEADAQAERTVDTFRFSFATRANRLAGIDKATEAYLDAAMATAIDMVNAKKRARGAPRDDKPKPYLDWKNCWGMVYVGVPYQFMETLCEARADLREVKAEIKKRINDRIQRMPAPIPYLANKYKAFKQALLDSLEQEAWDTGTIAAAAIFDDAATAPLLEMLVDPSKVDREKLVAAYTVTDNAKNLLLLPDIAEMIDADLAKSAPDGAAGLEKFAALNHSVVLAKLALMDFEAINDMYREHVGSGRSALFKDAEPLYPKLSGRHSILPATVRSIDGNHQWQAYGIPYPRTKKTPDEFPVERRAFGHNAHKEEGAGMRLFADQNAREKLFAKLFPVAFVGKIGDKLAQAPDLNRFLSCAAVPFPLTTDASGEPTDSDLRCLSVPASTGTH